MRFGPFSRDCILVPYSRSVARLVLGLLILLLLLFLLLLLLIQPGARSRSLSTPRQLPAPRLVILHRRLLHLFRLSILCLLFICTRVSPLPIVFHQPLAPARSLCPAFTTLTDATPQRTHVLTHAAGTLMHRILDPESLGGLGLRRCQWYTTTLNEASQRASLRLGYTYEGTQRAAKVLPLGKEGIRRESAWRAGRGLASMAFISRLSAAAFRLSSLARVLGA